MYNSREAVSVILDSQPVAPAEGTIMRQDQESVDKCIKVVDIVLLALTGGILALPFLMRENKDGPWLVERRNAA